jgi:polyhydroxybutyrate depolymerase
MLRVITSLTMALASLSAAAATLPPCNYARVGSQQCSIVVQGVTRTLMLHVPASYRKGNPLLVALHGSPGFYWQPDAQWSAKLDSVGAIGIYPQALPNSTGHQVWSYHDPTRPDDITFFRTIIAAVQSHFFPDPKRIYLTGFSAGGGMAFGAGKDMPDVLAAIAPVEAVGSAYPIPAKGPVAVVMLQGSADTMGRLCGFPPKPNPPSFDANFDFWAKNNKCSSFNAAPVCTNGTFNGTEYRSATGCQANTDVSLYVLVGGRHFWYRVPMTVPPGTMYRPYNQKLNSTTGTYEADVIWDFFLRHPKP